MVRHAAALLVATLSLGLAQSPTATLVGRVVDATGAIVPAVNIEVRHTATGEIRRATTAEAEFTIPSLAPGVYDVTVSKEGFRTIRQEGLELEVDQTARLELKLEIGGVSQAVEVTAAPPVVNTENAARGEVVASQEIVEMPLNGRDFNDLTFLVPGVSRKAQGGDGSNLAVNGARADNSNFIIDGFNNQNPRAGGAQARPPLDAILEFKMQVSSYSAEQGRLAGGVVNMALKSGGNQVHGTVFEFLRNDLLDARNFFDAAKHKLRRNQFGAMLDGPIVAPKLYNGHNRTFFLMSWESYRQVQGSTRLGRVPTEAERAGDFSQTLLADPLAGSPCTAANRKGCFPDNRIPASRLSPGALQIVRFYPLPNRPGQANNFLTSANDADAWDSFLGKVDHRVRDSDQLSFRILARFEDNSNPFAGDGSGIFGTYPNTAQTLAGLTYTRIFGPALLNELRLGMSRTSQHLRAATVGTDYAAQFGIAGSTSDPQYMGFPRITIRDLLSLGPPNTSPNQFAVTNYDLGDTLTWVRSQHLLKMGGDILQTRFFQPYANNVRGTLNFLGRWSNDPTADFLLGLLNNSSRQLGATRNYLFSTAYGFFVQDDYKVARALTLNLGLRYEILKPPLDKYDRWTNFIPQYGKVVVAGDAAVPNLAQMAQDAGLAGRVALARDLGLPRTLVDTNYRDLAPRAGIAWRPFGGTRTVLRSGYGIFYASSMTNQVRNDLGNVFPFAMTQQYQRQTKDPNALTLANPFPAALGKLQGVNNVNGYEPSPKPQYLQAWNFTVEHELLPTIALEAAYAGSKGTHLGKKYNINQPFRDPALQLPGGGFPKPYPEFNNINIYSFGSNSTYHAGMFSVRKHFSRGMFFRVSYVFSKSLDYASQIAGAGDGGYGGAQNPRNLKLERGRSDWDNRHAMTMSFVSELPWFGANRFLGGWQLAGSGRLYSGQPFTPQIANAQLDQGEANRPDRIAAGTLPHPTADRWFDLSAFPIVPTGSFRYGNSGRNILDGPGFAGINFSLMKRFRIREKDSLQFRWEVFNMMNHPNLNLPDPNVDLKTGATITQADDGRVIQFALKYVF